MTIFDMTIFPPTPGQQYSSSNDDIACQGGVEEEAPSETHELGSWLEDQPNHHPRFAIAVSNVPGAAVKQGL